ncbi:MAG TPA: hypothetical protein V6C81_13460 [Planktothrix sp.]|jgi:hypothetical protein
MNHPSEGFVTGRTLNVIKATDSPGLKKGIYRVGLSCWDANNNGNFDGLGVVIYPATTTDNAIAFLPYDGSERVLSDKLVALDGDRVMIAFDPPGDYQFNVPLANSPVVMSWDGSAQVYANFMPNAPTTPQPVQQYQGEPIPQPVQAAPLDPALNFPAGTVFTIWETDNPYLKKYLATPLHKATGFNVVQTQSTGVMARVDSESLVDAGQLVFIPYGNNETTFNTTPGDPYSFTWEEVSTQQVYLADQGTYIGFTDFTVACYDMYDWGWDWGWYGYY